MSEERLLRRGAALSGLLATLLGLVTMAGWHLDIDRLVQWSSDIVPMQYNTALAIALCGLLPALAAPEGRWRIAGIICASGVLIFSLLTGMQYITGQDYGLDRLLMDPSRMDQVKTVYPGRMAPNTTVCLMLATVAILCRGLFRNREASLSVALMLSLMMLAFSTTALMGYVFSIEAAYGWWSLSNMSPQTAGGLFLLGIGLTLRFLSDGLPQLRDNWKNMRVPVLAAAGGIILTLLMAQALLDQGQNRTQSQARAGAVQVAHILEEVFRIRTKEQTVILPLAGADFAASWHEKAENFLNGSESYQSVALIDAAFKPYAAAVRPGEFDSWDNKDFDRAGMQKAAQDKTVYIGRMPGADAGHLLIALPLNGDKGGFQVGAYNLGKNMNRVFGGGSINYHYEILDSEGLLTSNFTPGEKYLWDVWHEESVMGGGQVYRVRAHLNAGQYGGGGLIFIIFISGLCISVLFANMLYKAKKIGDIARTLKKSEERYAVAVEGAEIALWDWDVDTMTVEWAGQAWKMYGVASNADIPCDDRSIRNLIQPEDNEKIDPVISAELGRGDAFAVEFRLRQPDGKYRWVQSRGKAVARRDGAPVRIAGIYADITSLKRTEEQLRRMNEELEQFAYIASHDLKAPLRGIDNLAKWIGEDLNDVLTDDAREKMDLLRGRVSRLEMLLEDILQYSRAGRIVDAPVEVDTGKIIDGIIASISLPPGFSVDVAGDMPKIISSSTPLEQVFQNLISNAYSHHDKTQGRISVSAQDRGLYHEFIVSDDGPGIPAEFHERVFKMFQTLKSRDEKESTGLGLSIVKKLIEWQGGRVWIVSQEGQRGTSFHFLWPKKIEIEEGKRNAA